MNGISRPWRAGFLGGSGCSVGAGDHPKMQENVRKAVKNIRVISRKEMTRIILHTYCSRLFWLIIYEQPMAVQTFSLDALGGADS